MRSSTYYNLTKPRMVMGNVLVAAAAYVFGAQGMVDWPTFLLAMSGLALVVAGACVLNNIADRFMDARMERTKNRALVAGTVAPGQASIFGWMLFAGGVVLLLMTNNPLSLAAAVVGFVVYVYIYTPLKPKTGYAVYVGAVAGAMPPTAGYLAATHTLDMYALAIFLFLFLWQIPHFFAIARYRYEEYSAAGVPLLVKRPLHEAERRRARAIFYLSLLFLLLFCAVLLLFSFSALP